MNNNKIKLVIFDLDGVIFDGKDIHFNALNDALSSVDKRLIINKEEHFTKYDGLKTSQKLNILTKEKGLDPKYYEQIWSLKQEYTFKQIQELQSNAEIYNVMSWLAKQNIKIACCSNSIKKTIIKVLKALDIIKYFDIILSNEDVKNSKPHQEIYCTAMQKASVFPEETLIIEDSPYGLQAAYRSSANVLRVSSSRDVNLNLISETINQNSKKRIKYKWRNKNMNILIPMAGAGSRFAAAGYNKPKPLIDVCGRPMIQVVVENLSLEANYIFIVQKEHTEKYNLDTVLKTIKQNCKIIETDGLTEGAACTALLAKDLINCDEPLFFANSDQFVEWEPINFFYKMQETQCDGGIVTFKGNHPKWSYARTNDKNLVVEVAEKNPISNNATVGFYYWKKGSDFVKYAEQMIENNIRVNNEFYVCPVFNEAIKDNKNIITSPAERMWGLGTPEDLKLFVENEKL